MKTIESIQPFANETKKSPLGHLSYLRPQHGITTHDSISWCQKTVLANYIYQADETYQLVYSLVDHSGNIESFSEEEGILPTLFLSPDHQLYVSLTPYHPDKELEVSIPLFDRETLALPKANRPFTGVFIGKVEQHSLFYDVDPYSSSKPDRLLTIEFKDRKIKKKNQIKLSLPRKNKVFVANDEIHLFARAHDHWLHRVVDVKGEVIKQRLIQTKRIFYREALSLSFNEDSYLLAEEEGGKLIVDRIDTDGNMESIELYSLGDMLYNTWRPVKIGRNTFVTRFNNEHGNGWLTTRKGVLLELFYGKEKGRYTNLLNSEVLAVDAQDLIISNIHHTTENGYSVIFYPRSDSRKPDSIIVLNRTLSS